MSLDTNWDPVERWDVGDLLHTVDVFLPNAEELKAISGSSAVREAMASVGSDQLTIVTKLGARGAVARHVGELRTVTANRSVDFMDAVGAGDNFNAGYLAGLLGEREPEDCLRMAVAAGTLSTSGRGGTSASSTLPEVSAFGESLVVTPGFAGSL